MADRLVTVVKDIVDLYVETNEVIGPDVQVDYQSVPVKTTENPDPNKPPANISFSENLTAVPSPLRDPPNAKGLFAFRIKWKANLKNDPVLEKDTAVLVARVRGRSTESGRLVTAPVRDQLFVQAIDVTTDEKLTRIMLHEFAERKDPQDPSSPAVFDPKPAEAFIRNLDVAQKKMLCKVAEANPGGRLVVFVTMYDPTSKPHRMCADNGARTPSLRPNATFTVFHCRDLDKGGVTLVCHTEHFLAHMGNGDTQRFFQTSAGPKRESPHEYMRKTNPDPVEYKLVAHLPTPDDDRGNGHDGVIWCSPIRPDTGASIMPGNFLHGIINSHGCWMLFRNYNWPRSLTASFDSVYRLWRATDDGAPPRPATTFNGSPTVVRRLESFTDPSGKSYNFANPPNQAPPGRASSFQKFLVFDKNFAHLWFFHEIVGIKYFSTTLHHLSRRYVRDRNFQIINDFNIAGLDFENTITLDEGKKTPAFNKGDEGSFAAYDPRDRVEETRRGFRPDDSLWQENALGFKTASGFVGPFDRSVPLAALKSKAWADLFFYREDNVDLRDANRFLRMSAVTAS